MTASLASRVRDFFSEQASTRSAALMRMLIPLMLWARYGSDWLLFTDLSAPRVLLGASFFLSSTAMLVGWKSRFSALWTAVTLAFFFYYIGITKGNESYTHHHTYALLASTFLVALTPCGGSYSYDRYRALGRARKAGGPLPLERGPRWALTLIVLQLSMIYFWGAISKCTSAYLSGDRVIHYVMHRYIGSDYPALHGVETLAAASAWASVILEFALAILFFFPRTLRWVLPTGILFHAMLYYTLPVATYSATMWTLYLACIPPDSVHRFIDEIS